MSIREFFREYDAFVPRGDGDARDLLRLDVRRHAIIADNLDVIEGKRVLDIASHDGRMSFAALEAGAEHVLGVEGRPELVEAATRHLTGYGIAPERFQFRVGDAHEALADFQRGQFDTIFCLGFLHHTPHHVRLLREFRRLGAEHLILDTPIKLDKKLIVEFTLEDTSNTLMAIGNRPAAWAGLMSRPLLEALIGEAGYDLRYFDWPGLIRRLDRPGPRITQSKYADGRRVTVRCQRQDAGDAFVLANPPPSWRILDSS